MYRFSRLISANGLHSQKFSSADCPSHYNVMQNAVIPRGITTEASSSGTMNPEEIQKFEKMASEWWNPYGSFKPLHSMNALRVDLIRNGFMNNRQIDATDTEFPLKGLRILDIGCGGGILSQPLGRLGGTVTGLDAGKENITVAQMNLPPDLAHNIKFVCSTLEEFISANPSITFDGVVASEVVEHVQEPKLFLQLASQCVKPGGSLFVTTINRTTFSWLGAILGAEYLLNILPRGTHEWNKFISPEEVQMELNKNGCRTCLIHGMSYNVLCNKWSWTRFTSINYALHAVKET